LLLFILTAQLFTETAMYKSRAATSNFPEFLINGNTENTGDYVTTKSKSAKDLYGNTVIVWTASVLSQERIFYRKYDRLGNAITEPTQVTTTFGNQSNPDVSMDQNGNFFVIWENQDILNYLHLKAFKYDGTAIDEIQVRQDATDGAIAANYTATGNITPIVISFTENNNIYYSKYSVNTSTFQISSIGSIKDVATETSDEKYSDVAINSLEEVIVSWTDTTDIKYRILTADATVNPAEPDRFSVHSANLNPGDINARSAVAADKSPLSETKRFIVTYDGKFGSPLTSGIGVRLVNCPASASCSMDSLELIASRTSTGTPAHVDIAADYFGNFTIVWEISNAGSLDIKGLSFKYDGRTVNSSFDITETITGDDQVYPSISMNDQGRFTTTFTDKSSDDIYASEYITELFKTGGETLANSITLGSQADTKSDISPVNTVATVWKDGSNIRFTLKELDGTVIAQDEIVDSDITVSNPNISFFKDSSGPEAGYFVITWSKYGINDYDIYYMIYDSGGSPATTAAVLNQSVSDAQTHAEISAGYYPYFSATWISDDNIVGGFYNGTNFSELTLAICGNDPCDNPETDINESNNHIIYAWETGVDDNIAAIQAKYESNTFQLAGSVFDLSNHIGNKGVPAVAFVHDQFLITYINFATNSVFASRFTYNAAQTPVEIDSFEITPQQYRTYQLHVDIAADTASGDFFVVWNDLYAEETHVYGQFYDYTDNATLPAAYGPVFQINSTEDGFQTIPSAALNQEGHVIISWEGNVYQPDNIDDHGIATQLLNSPFSTFSPENLLTTCSQEITNGNRTLMVPDNIIFPAVNVSTSEDQTNAVSIRDGGATLDYIEITDELGSPFDLTVTASDLFSDTDNRSYIKNEQHFKIRNWDQNTLETEPACGTDPDKCFKIQSCSLPELTTFSLNSTTADFVTLDQPRTLATKNTNVENPIEIGKWTIYPELQITIPKFTPAGNHIGTITFTLN